MIKQGSVIFTVLLLLLTTSMLQAQKVFIHPGILHSQASLDHIYKVAQEKIMPEYGSYLLLKDNPLSAAEYKMNGPYKVIARDGDYRWTKSKMEADFSASYLNALMWVATKEVAHARKAWEILEAYADSLTLIPATNDAPLLAGLEGMKIVNALEILRYTWPGFPVEKVEKVNKMITGVFLPVCEAFYNAPAYTNGNWGPIVTKMYISTAIWFNNDAMYRKAVDFYYNAHDNGTIRNYINGQTGQIQESGRDQGHCQLGLGALATVCEIAWNQGDDLYGALDNRLLKGFEYVAKYNLGYDVPFTQWKDVTGKYSNWTTISDVSRGNFQPVYEMVYNHFVRIKKMAMPYTEQVIQKIRPEGYNRDQPAFGTLLFYNTGQEEKHTQQLSSVTLSSPGRTTAWNMRVNDSQQLEYRVFYKKKLVADWSLLGMVVNNVPCEKMEISQSAIKTYNEPFAWPLGEDDTISNHYNELTASCMGAGKSFQLIIRAYDGSIAFRYGLMGQDSGRINAEKTAFNFPVSYTIYQYNQETVFTPVSIDTLHKTCDFPATLTNGKLYLSIGEADNCTYTKAELKKGEAAHSLEVTFPRDKAVAFHGSYLTPWRTISVAESAIGLHDHSQLYLKLAANPVPKVPSWIKPGKLIRAQLNTQSGLDCIDFAVAHQFQYILFDAGWYGAEFRGSSDPTQVIPAIDMPKVIAYGKEKGIGVILYVNYAGLRAKLDTLLPLYKQWGVAGLKFGFVDGLTQDGLTWLTGAIKKVYDHGLILDIHDNYKPTGLSRTWPQLLTQEGIRGNENSPDAFHTTTLPFTRFLAGPADYTFCYPNATNSYSKNLKVSKAQQLALTVIYFSPLQSVFWYGRPKDYTNEEDIEFFAYVPTVWNESHYLAGDIGRNIAVARRRGDTWFVGLAAGINDWQYTLHLDFLQKGKAYTATIYEDEQGNIHKRMVTVKKGGQLPFDIKAKGGKALIIRPQ